MTEPELEQSTNPFAIIILAQLAALKKQEVELKLASKMPFNYLHNKGMLTTEISK